MYLDKSQLEYLAPAQLRPYELNARTHSKKQIGQIAEASRLSALPTRC